MKKTILTLLALALGGLASAITVQTGSGDGTTGMGNYNGFTLKLTDTFMEVENGPLSDLFQLESLTLSTPATGGSGHLNPFKVAVYQYTSDGTIGDFVALSEEAAWAASSSVTLNFGGINLETNQQYQYLFVNSSATVKGLTDLTAPGSTLLGNYQAVSGKGRISLTQMASLPSGDGTYTNNTIDGWEGRYIPQVTFTSTTPAVPEPATATLSLLALAGLAVRRRRK